MKTELDIEAYHPMLQMVLWYLEVETGLEFTITSQWRDGDTIHNTAPLRAVDLRCYIPEIGQHVAKLVNQAFEYDPQRTGFRCAIWHDNHLHIQVHANTVTKHEKK